MFENTIEEYFTTDFATINQNEPIKKSLSTMKEKNPPVVVVVDDHKKYTGMLSRRTIHRSEMDERKINVKKLVQYPPKMQTSDSFIDAANLMIHSNIKILPVFENDDLKGVISDEQIIHGATMENWGQNPISDIQTTELITFQPNDNIGSVRKAFRLHGISHAPILKNEKVVGIISIDDILDYTTKPRFTQTVGERKGQKDQTWKFPIHKAMVSNVITVNPDTTLKEAEKKMHENDISSVIITKDDKLMGIATKQDFLEPIAKLQVTEKAIALQMKNLGAEIPENLKSKMLDRFDDFEKMFRDVVFLGQLNVVFKKLGPGKKGDQHIQCNMKFWSKIGMINSQAEGYGIFDMYQEALRNLERQVKDQMEKIRDYQT